MRVVNIRFHSVVNSQWRENKEGKRSLRNACYFLPPRPNPRLSSRPPDSTPTEIIVAIAVDVRRVVTVREARVRGIVVPIAAAKAGTLYCYPFFSRVTRSLID